jgi:hypothetical protein
MDIDRINPAAHSDQTDFPIGDGKFKTLPTVAKGVAVTAAARKLNRGMEVADGIVVSMPEQEAMAIASTVVNPTELRIDVDRKRYSLHRTPSGHMLVSLETRVWTAAVSCDGANGRARLDTRLAGGSVWPLPTDQVEPSLVYRTRGLDRMRGAVRDNAKRIASADMRIRLREHPHGVWNPIYVVAGRLEIIQAVDAEPDDILAFAHAVEGSTRVVHAQEIVGLARDLPVEYAGNTLELSRRVRAGIAGRLAIQPDSQDVHDAVKLATLPAHVIIGVLDRNGEVADTAYREVIDEFVQSIHEEPRPWVTIAQGGVRGERLVRDLVEHQRLESDHGLDVVGRDEFHEVSTPINAIAGRLLRSTTHPDSYSVVRRAILEDTKGKMLTRKRYAQTVGSLLLAIYGEVPDRQKNRVAALTGGDFEPAVLKNVDWGVRDELTLRDVLDEALAHVEAKPGTWSPAAAELVARSVGALATLGLVFSDQGSAVDDVAWLRGSVARIVTGLGNCAGGLKILCEAAEKAENDALPWPVHYDADGNPRIGNDGKPERLHPDQGANVKVRTLAKRDEEPSEDEHGSEGDDEREMTPHDRYLRAQRRIATMAAELYAAVMDELPKLVDHDGKPKMDSTEFDREVLGDLPEQLATVRDLILVNLESEVVEPEYGHDEDEDTTGLSAVDGLGGGEDGGDDNPDVDFAA